MPQNNRPGFTFCICPDGHLIKEYIHSQLRGQEENWQVRTFWADEELPDAYWQALTWTNLLGRPTAVILRRAENFKAEDWKKLHPILGRFRAGIWPFFCLEKEWDRGKPPISAVLQRQAYWKVAENKGWVWRLAGLDRKGIQQRVERWADKHGIHIPQDVRSVLVYALPLDAAALANELDKLELFLTERKTMQADDLQVLSFQPDLDIFAFIRALQGKGQEVSVWRTLLRNQLGSNADMVMPFLALLLREARILWQLQVGEGNKVWMPGSVKAEKSKMAVRLGPQRLSRLWTMILEAESGIKSGDLSQSQAQELIVSRMMQIFGPEGRGQRAEGREG
ncbi:MAG: DNA polymerase III subunit delta [Desulfovermiculus sp.]|nr:DNA polymerase III subunit delta [Desulfovermiculus sp.]